MRCRAVVASVVLLGLFGCANHPDHPTDPGIPETDPPSLTIEASEIRLLNADGDYREAEKKSELYWPTILERHGEESDETMDFRDARCAALVFNGKMKQQEAFDFCDEILEIQRRRYPEGSVELARALNQSAVVNSYGADMSVVTDRYREALAMLQKFEPAGSRYVAKVQSNLAKRLVIVGEPEEALEHARASLEMRQRLLGDMHLETATSWSMIGKAHKGLGDKTAAREAFEKAYAIYREIGGDDHPETAGPLFDLCWMLMSAGEVADALPYCTRQVEVFEKNLSPGHWRLGWARQLAADCYTKLGDLDQAAEAHERAIAGIELGDNPESPRLLYSLMVLGWIQQKTGRHEEALATAKRMRDIGERSHGSESVWARRGMLRSVSPLVSLGRLDEARVNLDRIVPLLRLHEDRTMLSQALYFLSRVHVEGGQISEAVPFAREAAQIRAEILRTVVTSSSALKMFSRREDWDGPHGQVMTLLATGLDDEEAVRELVEIQLDNRGLLIGELAATHRRLWSLEAAGAGELLESLREARKKLSQLMLQQHDGADVEAHRKKILDARDELATLQLEAGRVHENASADRVPIRFDDLRRALPPDHVLISYVRYWHHFVGARRPERAYLAIVTRPGRDVPDIVPLGFAEKIDGEIAAWRELTAVDPRIAATGMSDYHARGAKLRESIWDPIAFAVRGATQVNIVADGRIRSVDFSTLPVAEDRFLVESSFRIHYASGERDLIESGVSSRSGSGLLVLGAPEFDSVVGNVVAAETESVGPVYRSPQAECEQLRVARFAPLPGTAHEIDDIIDVWDAADRETTLLLRGSEADEATFKRRAPGHRVLHLATHAFFMNDACTAIPDLGDLDRGRERTERVLAENPMWLSGLVLAGANRRHEEGTEIEEDGILTSEEIVTLDLRGVEWVVLSACFTGRETDADTMLGFQGLHNAFRIAGAETVILSLWPVEDSAAREWMREVYRARGEGLPTPEAVKQANLARLRALRADGPMPHPFFWAGFIAVGRREQL